MTQDAAPVRMTLQQYETIQPTVQVQEGDVTMSFATPSTFTRWRVDSIREKEPCTLEWIASFAADEVLLDCGANVGMYTIWSAVTRGARVFAFEPEAQNYALLNRNILLNGLMERVQAYCMGLSNEAGLSQLNMTDMRLGGSCHSVGDAMDFNLKPMSARFVQGCVVQRLDELVSSGFVPVPTHIKIDVDGFEHRVIEGARETLKKADGVRSLLIETNPHLAEHRAMVEELAAYGFRYDQAQVDRAARKEGPFKGVAEYIFRR